MNGQFETQNPVENTVTPANQMETPTPPATTTAATTPAMMEILFPFFFGASGEIGRAHV